MPHDFRSLGVSDSEFLARIFRLSHESRCSKDQNHDSCPDTDKYARKQSSFPLDEGMDRYLRIGMDLVPDFDRGGEISKLDQFRGGRALRLVSALHQARFNATANQCGRL